MFKNTSLNTHASDKCFLYLDLKITFIAVILSQVFGVGRGEEKSCFVFRIVFLNEVFEFCRCSSLSEIGCLDQFCVLTLLLCFTYLLLYSELPSKLGVLKL